MHKTVVITVIIAAYSSSQLYALAKIAVFVITGIADCIKKTLPLSFGTGKIIIIIIITTGATKKRPARTPNTSFPNFNFFNEME